MKYLVTYVTYREEDGGDLHSDDAYTDHYEAFDTLEDAQERYEDLTFPAFFNREFGESIKLWSANVSHVLRSTDYQ